MKNARTRTLTSERAPIGLAIDIRMEVSRSFTALVPTLLLSPHKHTHTEKESPAFQHVFQSKFFLSLN